jgi:hypothetical protein
MGTIAKLHDKARRAIAAGEGSFRQAAEYLAEARKQGATQRQSAKAIGKSPSWVNTLLKWQAAGFKDTPFGPQSKAKRAAVQAPKQSRRPMTAEHVEAERAKAEAMKARAEAIARLFPPPVKTIPEAARTQLIKALRALASDHANERAAAALIIERQRARLNLDWPDLLVPADAISAAEAA